MIKEYVKKIKPKTKGESDKYSWNLYRLLHKLVSNKDTGKFVDAQLKIYWHKKSWLDGTKSEFNEESMSQTRQILISPFGEGSFYQLSSVMGNKCTEFALIYPKEDLVDITEWFFNSYIKDGRCIFDSNHNGWWRGDKERFTYINNTRRCNWCGKWQHREIEKETIIKRREVWI